MRAFQARPRAAVDRGATIILFALLVTALFVITALVVDYGFVRQSRQANKSSADFAAAAGIRGLDEGTGKVNVWGGICTAAEFLRVNDPELADLTAVDSNDQVLVPDPCASPPTVHCEGPSDWRTYVGLADGGHIRVTIQNGYDISTSGFREDSAEYAGDAGTDPCEQLAVIVEKSQDAHFGGVAGASGYETTMRSVARLDRGLPEITAALILLEQHDCRALEVSGTNASVVVAGADTRAGAIHVDSLGDGANCNSKIFELNGNTPPPRIIAYRAAAMQADGTYAPGEISAVAGTEASGARPENMSDGVHEVCAQENATDCGNPSTGLDPTGRAPVTRSVADIRYLDPVRNMRSRAQARFDITTASDAADADFVVYPCGAGGPFTEEKVWIDCSATGNKTFDGSGKTFESSVKEVVIDGDLTMSGSGQTMHVVSPSKLYVRGYSQNAVTLGSDNRLLVNDGGVSDGDADGFFCDDRYSSSPLARTEFVVGSGRVTSTGGVFRLCQTTLLMMDDSGGDNGCPLPAHPGMAPYDNTCRGNVSVAGSADVDWTAPNVNNATAPTNEQLQDLEDLALWSETSGAGGSSWSIGGSGVLHLGGIFTTPNANPFRLNGGASIDIQDAQFVTRKLRVTGNGVLFMRPQARNSLQVPPLSGFRLVR